MLLSLRESCQEMWEHILKYTNNNPVMLILSLMACLYLLIMSRSFREKMLLPIIILLFIVVNPLHYSLLYGNNNLPFVTNYGLRYWRFFWMLPQGLLIGLAVVDMIRRISHAWLKCVALTLVTGIIIVTGQNIYHNEKAFEPATSAYKISRFAEYVCRTILEDNPQPLCMLDHPVSTEAREYSVRIKQLWGREGIWNVISDPEAYEVYNLLRSKPRDWERIFAFAEQRGVTHIYFQLGKSEDKKEMLDVARTHGYSRLAKVGRRYILHCTKE